MPYRLRVGFLINDLAGAYQFGLWSGIDAACNEKNIDLIVFTGGEVGATDPAKFARARVFEFANATNVDGLIISAPAVGNHMSHDQIVKYCQSFAPLPVVTLALDLPKVPSVIVDNAAGMEAAVEHLVTQHGRKQIAFIGGPLANNEAQARIGAYRRVLQRHGLGPCPHLELVADFDHGKANHCVKQLYADYPQIDAVVAANDDMALGAMEALIELGVKIPEQIAVCGFDDVEEAQFSTPSLFTVRQPLHDQGVKGVDLLLDLIAGKTPPEKPVLVPAFPVIRQSCGCETRTFSNNTIPENVTIDTLKKIHQEQLSKIETALQNEYYKNVVMQRKIRDLQDLSALLINTFDIQSLIDILSTGLQQQGITTSYLIFDPDDVNTTPNLMMAVEEGTVFPISGGGLSIQKGTLFPDGFGNNKSRRTLIVEPLFFGTSTLGFFIYSMPPCRGMIYEALRTTISAALQGARLVHQVRMRTEEAETANVNLQDIAQKVREILENIEQGLFTINLDGSINPEHSRSVERLLDIQDFEKSSLSDILRLSPEQEKAMHSWLDFVKNRHTTMKWEKCLRLAPVQQLELSNGESSTFIRISYQKMFDGQKNLQKIMILAIDQTESRRIEKVVAVERLKHENEVLTILGLVNTIPEIIDDYLLDTNNRITLVSESLTSMLDPAKTARENFPSHPPFKPDPEKVIEILSTLHTIKGNSATYGFETISRIAHEAEDLALALQTPIEVRVTTTIELLLERTKALKTAFDEVISVQNRLRSVDEKMVQIPESRIENLRKLAREVAPQLPSLGQSFALLVDTCLLIQNVPLGRLVEKYRKLAHRVSTERGKKVTFEAIPPGLELDPHYFSRIDEALLHIIRNALDHGLETPAERKCAGKEEYGNITLEVILNKDHSIIRISDDGRGIDFQKVIAKVISAGIIKADEIGMMSDEQKLNLIFESGISTAGKVTDMSGRGVGMTAARQNIMNQGGTLTISTEKGKGTSFEIVVPH